MGNLQNARRGGNEAHRHLRCAGGEPLEVAFRELPASARTEQEGNVAVGQAEFAGVRSPLAKVHFSHELTSFEQDHSGVTSVLKNLQSGDQFEVRSQYLVGADRGRTVGPAVGIKLEGPTDLVDMVSTHFTADLSKHIDDDTPLIRWFINPEGGGGWGSGAMVPMGPTHWDRRSEEWVFHFAFRPGDPDFDESLIVPRIRELLKLPDLDIKVHKVSHWIVESILAWPLRA